MGSEVYTATVRELLTIPVTGLGGLHCLDSRLIDGGKVVSPTHRPPSAPQRHYFYASDTHFCWRLSEPQGLVRLEGLGKLGKNSFNSSGLEPATLRLVVP
jgi:hypothetical protein